MYRNGFVTLGVSTIRESERERGGTMRERERERQGTNRHQKIPELLEGPVSVCVAVCCSMCVAVCLRGCRVVGLIAVTIAVDDQQISTNV